MTDPPFGLGQTLGVTATTDGTGWVGAVKHFTDVNPSTGKLRTNRHKVCIAVRNASTVVLLPKRLVTWKSGSLSEVDGYTRLTDIESAGVVDEYIPSTGVAVNDVFWLTVNGPTEVKLGPAAQAAVDTHLVSLTAAASTNSTTAGQAQTAAATYLLNGYIGKALSAGTTGVAVLAVVNLVRS